MPPTELAEWGTVEVVNWSDSPPPWDAEAWPVSFAVLWIAWRDLQAVEKEWIKILKAGFRLDNAKAPSQYVALRDAQAALWHALHGAKLEASASFSCDWRGRLVFDQSLSARYWTPHLRFDVVRDHLIFEADAEPHHYTFVTVPRARIVELWPVLARPPVPATDAIPARKRKKPGTKGEKTQALRRCLFELGTAEAIRAEKVASLTKRFDFSNDGSVSRIRKAVLEELESEKV